MHRATGRGSLVSEQLSDVGSTASSSSRRVASLPLKDALDGDEQEDDEVATTAQAVELAIFGVLYTLSKEKVDVSKWLAVLKMVLDFLQQLVVLLSPMYGWYPWTVQWTSRITWIWKGLSYLNFREKLAALGYGVYTGFLYAIGSLLVCSLLLCAYVGYCFKRHKFTYVWPVWTLRVVVSVFFQTFYVSAMGIFLGSINCHWLAPADSQFQRGYLDDYPDKRCLDYPCVLNLVLSIIFLVIFSATVFVTTASDFELDPLAKGLLAAAHPRIEVINLGAKTVFLLASAILVVDLPKLQAIIFAAAMAVQFYTITRWVPALTGWVNHLRAGFNLGLTWVSIILVVLKCLNVSDPNSKAAERMTFTALAGIPGMVAVGVLMSWMRLAYFTRRALQAFHKAPTNLKLKDIYQFVDIYEVEVASRVCRTPGVEAGSHDDASVKLAERIVKTGIAMFPNEAFAHILYSNLLIEVQTLYQAGQSQLMAAKKLNPGYVEKFAIFVREQQHMQRAHTQTTGESAVDLVSYVEFQRNYRLLARATQRALTTQQAFWRLLLNGQVHFSQLTTAFNNIEAAQKNATQTFRMVLDRYPNSVRLLRSYARFQEEVMNNPWRASQLYEKADRLEEQQAVVQDNILYSVDNRAMLTQVDDKTNAVAVINASGVIQMTNKMMQKMFGYKASELDGQSVSMLMPAPFSSRHQGYIAAYLATGQPKIIDSIRQVIALHRRRYMFPIRLAVTKLSGQGQDSTFMGIMRPIEADADSITVWCLTNGIALSVDQRFQDVFGLPPSDVIGRNFKDLLVEQDELQGLMNLALGCSEEELADRNLTHKGMHVQHKYAGPVQVDVTIQRGGTVDEPLHAFSLVPVSMMAPPLVVFNRSGNIVFASAAMSQLLGYTTRSLAMLTAEALMPAHYQILHAGGIRELIQHKSSHTCRNGETVFMSSSNKALVPVRLSMTHKAEGEDNLLTVVEVAKSSVEAGLDERRVKLELTPAGEIVAVKSLSCSQALFGFIPEHFVGTSVFKLFPELAGAAQSEEEQEEVLEALRLMSIERLAPIYIRTCIGNPELDMGAGPESASPSPADRAFLRVKQEPSPLPSRLSIGDMPASADRFGAPVARHQPTAMAVHQAVDISGFAGSINGMEGDTAAPGGGFGEPSAKQDTADSFGGPDDEGSPLDTRGTAGAARAAGSSSGEPIQSAAAGPLASQDVALAPADGGPRNRPGGDEASSPGPHIRTVGIASARFGPSSMAHEMGGGISRTAQAQRFGQTRRLQPSELAPLSPQSSGQPPQLPAADVQSPVGVGGGSAAGLTAAAQMMTRAASLGSFTAIAASAMARSRLATRGGRLQRQGGPLLGLIPRPVILEFDGTSGENITISIWHPDKVAAIMEVSKDGDIRQAALDELHPPGPMFGLSSNALLQFNLRDVLGIPPDTSVASFLFGADPATPTAAAGHHRTSATGGQQAHAGAKSTGFNRHSAMGRGVLKSGASNKKGRTRGPVLHVTTRHADGRPLHLTVQALPKKTSHNAWYIRCHLLTRSNAADAAIPAAAFNAALGRLCGPGTLVRMPAAALPCDVSPAAGPGATRNAAAAPGKESSPAGAAIPAWPSTQPLVTGPADAVYGAGPSAGVTPAVAKTASPFASGRDLAADTAVAASPTGTSPAGVPLTPLVISSSRSQSLRRHIQHARSPSQHPGSATRRGAAAALDVVPAALQEWQAQQGGGSPTLSPNGADNGPAESSPAGTDGKPILMQPGGGSWSVAYSNSLFAKQGSSKNQNSEDRLAEATPDVTVGPVVRARSKAVGDGELSLLPTSEEGPSSRKQELTRRQPGRLDELRGAVRARQNRLLSTADDYESMADAASGMSSPETVKSDCMSYDEDDPLYLERMEALATLGPAADEEETAAAEGLAADGLAAQGVGAPVGLFHNAHGGPNLRGHGNFQSPRQPRQAGQGQQAHNNQQQGRQSSLVTQQQRNLADSIQQMLVPPYDDSFLESRTHINPLAQPRDESPAVAAAIDKARALRGGDSKVLRGQLTMEWLQQGVHGSMDDEHVLTPAVSLSRRHPGVGAQKLAASAFGGGSASQGLQETMPSAHHYFAGAGGPRAGLQLPAGGSYELSDMAHVGGLHGVPLARTQPAARRASVTFIGHDVTDTGHVQLTVKGGDMLAMLGTEGPTGASPPTDVASEHDQSYTGMHALQAQDTQRQADFQRGRRLKRISKVLERPQARHAINRFSSHSSIMAMLLTISHLACAVAILILLGQLSSCVKEMSWSGITLDFMHRAALDSRVLDQLHKNRTQAPLYTLPDGFLNFEENLSNSTLEFERRHVEAYRHAARGSAARGSVLSRLWESKSWQVSLLLDPTLQPPTYSTVALSLFEMGKQFVDSARDIQANHKHYVDDLKMNLTSTGSLRFIQEEAVWQITDAYVQMLDTLALQCIHEAGLVNRVMLALLVVEACCICGAACVYLSYRLMQVSKYRCSLFSVFLAIPSATLKMLASRQVHADGDDGSTDSASASPLTVATKISSRGPATKTYIPSFYGGMQRSAQLPRDPKMLVPRDYSTGLDDSSAIARMVRAPIPLRTSFIGIGPIDGKVGNGNAGRRWWPGEDEPVAGAAQQYGLIAGDGTNGRDLDAYIRPPPGRITVQPGNDQHVTSAERFRMKPDDDDGDETDIGDDGLPLAQRKIGTMEALTTAGGRIADRSRQAAATLLKTLVSGVQSAARRASQIFRRKSKMAGTNKVLVAHSLQNWWLVLPIIVWAVLIISLYAVSYSIVKDIYSSMETLNVASFNVWRVSRVTYFAHELCALEDTSQLSTYREYLRARCAIAAIEWDVLLYGSKSESVDHEITVFNKTGVPYRLSASAGIAHSGDHMTDLLFATTDCMRFDQSSCFSVGHPLYMATHQGMSTIMRGLFRSCDLLVADPDANISLNSSRLSYMFQVSVGLNDARDGTLRVRDYYEDMLMSKINNVRAIHIGLLIALFVLILIFIFYLVRPFVRYTREEAKHVAKLLSELGQDIDVERLVENALGVARPESLGSKKDKRTVDTAGMAS